MCLNPKWIYKKGKYKENNYNGMKDELYEIGTFSKCGHCEQCIAEKANSWVVRNHYESQKEEDKCFITLTYKDDPIILIKKDLQDFLKRFRIYLQRYEENKRIRFFAAGEYGTLSNRPHFHIIVYGWNDKKAHYQTINEKKQIVLKSEIIEKIWGKGITSIQEFASAEAPYIALYETAKETFKKSYILTRKKVKDLEEYYKTSVRFNEERRKILLDELYKLRKILDEKKLRYMEVKEFNTWSRALGWNEFEKEFLKSNNYVFTEYIEDKEFVTPTPWVKKLANQGYYNAIIEMRKRQEYADKETNETIEKNKNEFKMLDKRKKEIMELHDKKQVTSIL